MRALVSLAGASALAARLLNVRIRLKTRRLRRARRSVWRARLAADLVLAMRSKIAGGSVMDALPFVNRERVLGARVPHPGSRIRFLCRRDRCLGSKRRNARLLRAWL